MLALQGIDALKQFGAQQQVTFGVALSVTREFAPLITGIVVAGRSGSALAARIGTGRGHGASVPGCPALEIMKAVSVSSSWPAVVRRGSMVRRRPWTRVPAPLQAALALRVLRRWLAMRRSLRPSAGILGAFFCARWDTSLRAAAPRGAWQARQLPRRCADSRQRPLPRRGLDRGPYRRPESSVPPLGC